jgi:hypothetical protein
MFVKLGPSSGQNTLIEDKVWNKGKSLSYSLYMKQDGYVQGYSFDNDGNNDYFDETNCIVPGPEVWNHLALVHDHVAQQKRLYLNGIEVDRIDTDSGPFTPNDSDMITIGRGPHATKGMLDEVRIYGRVLSEAEIRLIAAPISDCNRNGVPDRSDLDPNVPDFDGVVSRDCNLNGIPDECDVDPNDPNGPISLDCNVNGIPDECDADCNGNGIPDQCDVDPNDPNGPISADCNGNGIPDECDLNPGDPNGPFSSDCNANGIPDECEPDCNFNGIPDECDVDPSDPDGDGQVSSDCNGNSIPDDCDIAGEVALVADTLTALDQTASTVYFAQQRTLLTYADMIASYGVPWPAESGRTATLDPNAAPATQLRALAAKWTCGSDPNVFLPVFHELYAFELLLGNEGYSDALDVTIGLNNGVVESDLGDLYSFQGVVGSLLDEDLGLLRGQDLCPGGHCDPNDWLGDTIYYPVYSGTDSLGNPGTTRAAVYNRLPPNAEGFNALAYQSNYGVLNNYAAVLEQYPQGHGDAYGYYLTALKTYLNPLRGDPNAPEEGISLFADGLITAQPWDTEAVASGGAGVVPVGYQAVRNMAGAMVARARAGVRTVDLTFRRDYRADPEDPQHAQLLEDVDRERAWGTADWARRTGLGAYLDWAVASQLTQEGTDDTLGVVNRSSIAAIGELAATVGQLQERIDTAGAGLNPLGLVPNVVPFGISAASLKLWVTSGGGQGQSHYEQVRTAALNALDNARSVLEYANQAAQRQREQGESFQQFVARVADQSADYQNRLIELHGYPSVDDPADNDLDPTTDDVTEAIFSPDLVNFLLDAQAVGDAGWTARVAPGEIQLAMSELRTAQLRIENAQNELDALRAETDDLTRFIAFREGTQAEEIEILNQATQETLALIDRIRQMKQASLSVGSIKRAIRDARRSARSGRVDLMNALFDASQQQSQIGADSEMQREMARINSWKEVELTQISQAVEIERERLRLQALMRQSPQLMVNLKLAQEYALQAAGRLNGAVQRGQRVLAERERTRRLERDQLEQYRWEDLAYRVYRNNALQKYDAFFDLAARYVMLAGRSFAYEYNDRSVDDTLERITRERRLGNAAFNTGGLQGVIQTLDSRQDTYLLNRQFNAVPPKDFYLRSALLGLGPWPEDTLAFRVWLESHIVQRLEELPVIQDYVTLSSSTHFGPAIVIPFATENTGDNFFGNPPDLPFGGDRFAVSRNAKILEYAVRFEGVDPFSLGGSNDVSIFLIPLGNSMLREDTNQAVVEDEPVRPWSVVDQWLSVPPLVSASNPIVQDPEYNPWVETGGSGGNYLNAIKRFQESQGQIIGSDPINYQPFLAGRAVWNTEWLLVIPGAQWTGSSNPATIRAKLMNFLYGATGNPADGQGITNIILSVSAYER